jgi:hypothetical protein
VEQAEWDDISVISYSDAGVVATLRRAAKPLKDTPQTTDRTITVDFVLLRSVTRGIKVRVLRLACVESCGVVCVVCVVCCACVARVLRVCGSLCSHPRSRARTAATSCSR